MAATLNPDEISALMSAIQDGRLSAEQQSRSPSGAPVSASPYDLTNQDRIIRGQMPALDAINERIASIFASGLVGRTRLPLRVNSSPSTLAKFLDVYPLLAPPAAVAVLSLGPGGGQALAVLESNLSDALLSAALGDKQARVETPTEGEPRRELTSLERQVLRRLLSFFTDAMGHAWEGILPIKPEVTRIEVDPRMAVIAPPNETAVLCAFEVEGPVSGRMQLAIPYPALEPAKKQLSSPVRPTAGGDARFRTTLEQELLDVGVNLRVLLGTTSVPLSRLLSLQEGDLLVLDTDETRPLPVLVEGRAKLLGRPQVAGGNLAVTIEETLTSGQPATPTERGRGTKSGPAASPPKPRAA